MYSPSILKPLYLNKKSNDKKLRVFLQGGLHGDEMASSEGVLFLMEKLLNDSSYSYLLNKLEIAIIPIANIDGYEIQDRYAANGLDLNRDQTKLMIKESIFLKQTFSDFNPHVAMSLLN
jgi:predicted deacylase